MKNTKKHIGGEMLEQADSGYWADWEPSGNNACIMTDRLEGKNYKLTGTSVYNAARKLVNEGLANSDVIGRVAISLATDDWQVDSADCDCIVQIACFGEIKYG